jgi:SAM-dependent methyltransferase
MFSDPNNILRQCGVSPGSIVGDFGSGAGTYAHEAAALVGPQGVVYAFDIQKDLVARLTREIQAKKENVIHPLWVDLEHPKGTGLSAGTLDLGIAANVLFQVEDKNAFIKEIVRVLRPGGRLLLIDWKESFGHMGPHPDHVVRESDAQKTGSDAGLVLDKTIDAGAHHYGLIFRKQTTNNGQQTR